MAADGTVVMAGVGAGPVRGDDQTQEAHALVGSPDAGWQDVAMGGQDLVAPLGYPNVRFDGAVPANVVHGENGFVATGWALFYDSSDVDSTMVGAFWHSLDGLEWQISDLRDVVGHDRPFVPAALTAVPGGYLAAGLLADSTEDRSDIVVLSSTDGIDWNLLSRLTGTWSLEPTRLIGNGDEVLLTGVEYACTADSRWLSAFALARPGPHKDGAVARLWRSTDGGEAWEPIDLTLSGLVTQPEPMPQTADECSGLSEEDLHRFQSQGDLLGVIDGHAVVSNHGDEVAISSDLATWVTYKLPEADPVGGEGGCCDLLSEDEHGLLLIDLQGWRDLDEGREQDQPGIQTQVWRLTDSGGVEKLPLGHPVPPTFGPLGGRLVGVGESEVWLIDNGIAFYRSTAGPYRPWGVCTVAAEADCSFVTADLTAPGVDLHGIDLRATIASGGDLSGANLTDALLGWATLLVPLNGANLAGADLTHAQVDVTFFAAQRSDSTVLDELTVVFAAGQSLEGFNFSGQKLANVRFHGVGLGSSMRAANFSNADLTNVSFSRVDLTDANFDGAQLDAVFWGVEVTCPDGGTPNDSNPVGAEGCRLS